MQDMGHTVVGVARSRDLRRRAGGADAPGPRPADIKLLDDDRDHGGAAHSAAIRRAGGLRDGLLRRNPCSPGAGSSRRSSSRNRSMMRRSRSPSARAVDLRLRRTPRASHKEKPAGEAVRDHLPGPRRPRLGAPSRPERAAATRRGRRAAPSHGSGGHFRAGNTGQPAGAASKQPDSPPISSVPTLVLILHRRAGLVVPNPVYSGGAPWPAPPPRPVKAPRRCPRLDARGKPHPDRWSWTGRHIWRRWWQLVERQSKRECRSGPSGRSWMSRWMRSPSPRYGSRAAWTRAVRLAPCQSPASRVLWAALRAWRRPRNASRHARPRRRVRPVRSART